MACLAVSDLLVCSTQGWPPAKHMFPRLCSGLGCRCSSLFACCRDCELLPGCLEPLPQFRGMHIFATNGACTGLTPEGVVAVATQLRAQGSVLLLALWLPEDEDRATLQALVKQEGLEDFVKC